jgi:hypothetical protein
LTELIVIFIRVAVLDGFKERVKRFIIFDENIKTGCLVRLRFLSSKLYTVIVALNLGILKLICLHLLGNQLNFTGNILSV